MKMIVEEKREIPVVAEVDVVVVGGGPAGIMAALASARGGASTILIERFGGLGGMGATGMNLMIFALEEPRGITKEIWIDRMLASGYAVHHKDLCEEIARGRIFGNSIGHAKYWDFFLSYLIYDAERFRYEADLMMEEAGVRVYYQNVFAGTIAAGGRIQAIVVENVSGRQAVRTSMVVDATGAGDVVARVGAPFIPAADTTGAPVPAGMMYKMSGVDIDRLIDYLATDPGLATLVAKAQSEGALPYYRRKQTLEKMGHYDAVYTGKPRPEIGLTRYSKLGELLCWGGPVQHEWKLDPSTRAEDLSRAFVSIRKQIIAEVEFFTEYVPGFEKAYLAAVSPYVGAREKRHPIGEYMLTANDVESGRRFDDMVVYKGPDPGALRMGLHRNFDIPYRALLPKETENLLVAGDCISADHGAFLNIRSLYNAGHTGEVAGTAAALAVKGNTDLRTVEYSNLKARLIAQGVFPDRDAMDAWLEKQLAILHSRDRELLYLDGYYKKKSS
jgi:2-polyprenyl-6-methoxyphenol hydroxylase-like FAD-dependent oxidoreductase